MKSGHAFVLLITLLAASCSSQDSGDDRAPTVPASLQVTVEYLKQGSTSLSVPGSGAFITLDPARNLVLCATSISGITDCYPDDPFSRSGCPATERCSYTVWREEDGPVAISTFSMNLTGQGVAEQALDSLEEAIGAGGGATPEFIENARNLNNRRAFWLSSFILADDTLDLEAKGRLETIAREAVLERAMPGSADADEGALSSPFETCFGDSTGYWQCRPLRDVSLEAYAVME